MSSKLLIGIFALILLEGIAYAIIWSGPTYTEFKTTETNPVCNYEDHVWEFWNVTLNRSVRENSLIDCYRDNGQPSQTCCPSRHTCNISNDACTGPPAPLFCANYTTKQECKGFHQDVANRSVDFRVGKSNYCGSIQYNYTLIEGRWEPTCWWWIVNCSCVWNASTTACESQYSETNLVCNTTTPITTDGTCTFSDLETAEECNTTGFIKYFWNARWTGETEKSGDCNSGSKSFKCGAKLVFFTVASLIIAILIIILIYLLILKKREKKGKARKKKK